LPDAQPLHSCYNSCEVATNLSSATAPAILLVDDNPHDVVLLRLAFRRVGIIDPIKLVKDGADAVRYLRGEGAYADRHAYPAPTLMLLDLKMPQTSGFDVLRWVREQPFLKHLTVVVMTGSKESEDVQRAYELGADSYLVKPTKFSDLVKITQSLKSYCSAVADGARSLRASYSLGFAPALPEASVIELNGLARSAAAS
jgi:CheY-like chemotaxis protein